MADSSTKTRSKDVDEGEDPKAALPVGHPQAGYTSPDLSFHEGRGKLPDEEKEWHRERNEARAEQAEKIVEHEDKVATEEAEAEAKELKERSEADQKRLAAGPGFQGAAVTQAAADKGSSSSSSSKK